jgi:hypothetical protein
MININMDKNLNPIAAELFGKIRTQFPKIQLGDANSDVTDREEDARFFEFDFVKNGVNLGTVSVDISEDDGMVVIYSNEITDGQPTSVVKQWFNFLRELREFAKQNMMKFSIRDTTKSNLDKRDYKHLANKNGEAAMNESKLWGTNKTSFQDIGEAKLIVRHNQPVNLDLAAGRTMHIESIYIESAEGERFKYPFKHLNGARALANHVSHGGNSYDPIGQHIIGLSEEMNKLRMFKGYVSRNPVVSEAMGAINNKVFERIDQVKKEIHQLQNPNYYASFAESFASAEEQMIPEDVVNDWIDRLTIRSFNEELKNVFPYIYKLVGEEVNVVKELSVDDLLAENPNDSTPHVPKDYQTREPLKKGPDGKWRNSKGEERDSLHGAPLRPDGSATARGMNLRKEESLEDAYESFLNNLVSEESDLFNNDESSSVALQKLNALMGQEFPGGADGTNAIQSLAGIIDDEELTNALKVVANLDPESDLRDIVKQYLEKKDEENGTDIATKVNFGEPGVAPAPEAPPAEPVAAAPAPAAPPVDPAAAAVPAPTAPVAEEKEDPPFDGPYKKPGDNKDRFGNTVKNPARHAAKKGMAAAIAKAKKAGATAETVVNFGFGEMSLGEAIGKAGLDVEEFFEGTGKQNEVVEFVKSMYDETTGNFPKGETGVLLAVEKQFGEDAAHIAHKVISELSQVYESKRMRQLAGLDEQFPMMDPQAMMQQQMGAMKSKMPNLDPAAMMKSQQDRMAQMKANMPQGGTNTSSFKVNGKPVSKAEYDAFMAKNPQLGQNMQNPQNVVKGNPELARMKKMAGMPDDNDW